jgi:hypothetical protein
MLRTTFLIIILISTGLIIQGKKIATLEENFKKPIIRVDDRQFYIVDPSLVKGVIYDRSNLKKVGQFGSYGQGPGELTSIQNVTLNDKFIYVSDFTKLCIFSKQGRLIKELKGPFRTTSYIPFGDNFVGTHSLPQDLYKNKRKVQFILFDGNLKKKKDLFITEIHSEITLTKGKELVYWFRDCFGAFVNKNNLVVGTTEKGLYFAVFNLNGEKLYDIKRDEKKREVTEEEKKRIIKNFSLSMGEEKWNQYKATNEIIFSDYYPAYWGFIVNDDKIYVFPYSQFGVFEIPILDLNGNLLKRSYLMVEALGALIKYVDIFKGKLYNVIENDEEWELNEIDIFP